MRANSPLRHAAFGAAGGLVGTIPMTVLMKLAERELPPGERYALPPKRITANLAEAVGAPEDELNPHWDAKTYAGHFAYGTATGAGFGAVWSLSPAAPNLAAGIATGVAYGLCVWAASYLGWLPAVGLHPPATREPASRNALMIGAHVVWGGTLGAITAAAFAARRTPVATDPALDRGAGVAAPLRRRYARRVDPDRGG